MDKRVLRERKRKKQQQLRRRQMMKKGASALALILVFVFVVRGIIIPVANRVTGKTSTKSTQTQTTTDTATTDTSSTDGSDTSEDTTTTTTVATAIRKPLKSQNDLTKASQLVAGWHEDENGKWYQNADGSYFAGGMQEIDGSQYYFDDNGYIQTGWVSVGFDDYYFNDDGTYDPTQHKTRIALTFDDGPGEYTDELLDCLEQNNAHATFFMVGQNVGSWQSTVQRMVDIGCELGNHTWDHPSSTLTNLSIEEVQEEFQKTDAAIEEACGQTPTVARAPYGAANEEIYEAVQKPFFMWSLDTEDWKLMDADADYNAVMNGDLTDGSIILMHDIHQPSVEAAIKFIPELVEKGYKLMTVSELAAAKGVTLQNTTYADFWDSELSAGTVAGYSGNTTTDDSTDGSDATSSDDSSDSSDSSSEDSSSSDESSSDDSSSDESSSDDSSSDESSSDDGSYDEESYDDSSYDDSSDYSDEGSGDDESYDTGY